MSNTITLDDLDAAVENQFAPLRFNSGTEEFVLRNVVRLSAKERETVLEALHTVEELRDAEAREQVDVERVVAALETILKNITADGKGAKLLKVLGGDLTRCQVLFMKWVEVTQAGEAQGSRA